MKEKKLQSKVEELMKEQYGMDPAVSLQTVNFATTENSYLNEHDQSNIKKEN